ncbi:next to BRCA1 gene 1 protein isoform X2 [Callorhinchus milii]|uniref:next to BRCA1 gene 1 protein isoform X2 n=1 Tax=Callorhinchus milii TaxID=7868 RepID=UPI001C3FB270|nr:next to BRCA1 gene 1 protein isoform X2 [Callorhinchus milii]
MEPHIRLSVTYGAETLTFLVSDSERTTWADLEAMVQVSFDLNNSQLKYIDEDNEEVSVNSQEEYQEALKRAAKQANHIQVNVYEGKQSQIRTESQSAKKMCENGDTQRECLNKKPKKKEMKPHSQLLKTIDQDAKVSQDCKRTVTPKDADHNEENWQLPPAWFTGYMETFKEKLVSETVDRICCEVFHESTSHRRWAREVSSVQEPSPLHPPLAQATRSSDFDWHMACSHCQSCIVGVRYQCSVCQDYSVCEACEAGDCGHDPAHSLLKLRRPPVPTAEPSSPPLRAGTGFPGVVEQARLQKQMEKTFLKAEKQRLRTEKKQRKAEFKEIRKQLKLQKKSPLWNGLRVVEHPSEQIPLPKGFPAPATVPVSMWNAEFVDENFLDGTHLQPGFQFTKHWRMKNTGNIKWTQETKEGASSEAGMEDPQVTLEPKETESSETAARADPRLQDYDPSADFYTMVPSVDLLTAQDLLSFELLDINIVQEMERVPHNTPVDMTPCMSPLPYDGPLIERQGLGQIEEETEAYFKPRLDATPRGGARKCSLAEEGEEDISGTQFVCETVIRSLTLDEAPDLLLRRREKLESLHDSSQEVQEAFSSDPIKEEVLPDKTCLSPASVPAQTGSTQEETAQPVTEKLETDVAADCNGELSDEENDDAQSQGSSDCSEDYIIILPDCFDTTRPLGDSMYSSALSQPGESGGEGGIEVVSDSELTESKEADANSRTRTHNVNDMLCASQTLDTEPLTPEVVPAPVLPHRNDSTLPQLQPDEESETAAVVNGDSRCLDAPCEGSPRLGNTRRDLDPHSRHPSGLAGGLMKGALSVAASAYKALFSGETTVTQSEATESQVASLMDVLFEMGFCDRPLNMRLMKKHNHNLIEVVTELLNISDNDWYAERH